MFYFPDLICAGGKVHKKYEHPAWPRPFTALGGEQPLAGQGA